MSNIPEHFEYCKSTEDPSIELYSFLYDHSVRQFIIAGKSVALESFDPYVFNEFALGLNGTGIEYDDMPAHALLLPSYGSVIAGPKLHEWVDEYPTKVSEEARRVMFDTYKSLLENGDEVLGAIDLTKSPVGHMDFAAGPRENGGINLQVFGDCACMGPDPDSHVIDGQFEAGFAEYYLHNADTQVQRASLYAGLGHLARLASSIEPAQQQLFDSITLQPTTS